MSDPLRNLSQVLTGLGPSATPRVRDLLLVGTFILIAIGALVGIFFATYALPGGATEVKTVRLSVLAVFLVALMALVAVMLYGIIAAGRRSDGENGARARNRSRTARRRPRRRLTR